MAVGMFSTSSNNKLDYPSSLSRSTLRMFSTSSNSIILRACREEQL